MPKSFEKQFEPHSCIMRFFQLLVVGTCKTIIRSKSDRNDAVVSARYVYGSQPGRFHAFCVAHFAGEVT